MKYNFDEIIDRNKTNCAKIDACKVMFGSKDIIPLWVADMDFRTPDFIIEALKKRLEHEILGYQIKPDSFYKSAQMWLNKRGWDCNAKHMGFSPGIVPAINMAIMAYTEPSDSIMIMPPVYHPFIYAIKDNNRNLVDAPLLENNGYYTMDFAKIENEFKKGVQMLIFCSPHNPIGRVWTKEELSQLGELCLKYNVIILSDEIHSDLITKSNKHTYFASLSQEIANITITFIAPSKTFNLAGLYTSIVHSVNKEMLGKFNKVVNTLHVSGGNIFGDISLEVAYTNGEDWLNQLNSYLLENFRYIKSFLEKNIPQIKVNIPEGTYLMWLNCKGLNMDTKTLKNFMVKEAKIGLNSGDMFGEKGVGYMRLNAASPKAVLIKAMEQLKEAVDKINK